MKWNRVIDCLPEIPVGKHSIQVIVAEFDTCYDEINPGKGYDVHCLSFGKVDYEKMPEFRGSIYPDGSNAFMTMYYEENTELGPTGDEVTHWMHLPEAPEYDGEVLNSLFKWYHEHALPQSPLKEIK